MIWKVYKTYLEKWQPFVFYCYNGKLIPTSDMNNPVPPTNMYWVKETNSYPKIGPVSPEKISAPTVRMNTKHINDYFKINFPAYFKICHNKFENLDCYMHLMIKDCDDDTSEVSMLTWYGIGEFIDEKLQIYIDKYIKLIIFS